ncbi:MAG TPA: hypothetical protein PLF31_00735 [Candidatus Paceibacterota bacterium]|nr:hypothetical protein [Candidatus Paceibacterota bacterium]
MASGFVEKVRVSFRTLIEIRDAFIMSHHYTHRVLLSEQEFRLQQEATSLLRRNGCTWAGRSKKSIRSEQVQFETKMIRAPFRGASKGQT